MSPQYRAVPVTLAGPSTRRMSWPMAWVMTCPLSSVRTAGQRGERAHYGPLRELDLERVERSRRRGRELGGCGVRERGRGGRLADQARLGPTGPPRLGGHAAERKPDLGDRAVLDPHRGRHRGQRELVGLAVAELQVHGMTGHRGGRDLDRGDQLAVLKRMLPL